MRLMKIESKPLSLQLPSVSAMKNINVFGILMIGTILLPIEIKAENNEKSV